jgi:hypothetical protein
MMRRFEVAAMPSGPVMYTDGMSNSEPSARSSRRSCIHHATSSSVVRPGVMTSLESARSVNWMAMPAASPNATISAATRRERKSATSRSALTRRDA